MTQKRTIALDKYHSLDFLHKRTVEHLRVGKERLDSGKISLGIITLYDALITAMNWFMAIPENRNRVNIREGEDHNNDKVVFNILARCGIIDRGLNFDAFNDIVEEALKKDMSEFDFDHMRNEIENVMRDIGIFSYMGNEASGNPLIPLP